MCDPVARNQAAQQHWPHGMAFEAEHEQLLAQGWPFMRVGTAPAGAPSTIASVDALLAAATSSLDGPRLRYADALWWAEAKLGTAALLDRVLTHLERLKKVDWAYGNLNNGLLTVLFVLETLFLRAPRKAAEVGAARLRALHAKRPKDGECPYVAWRIQIILEGAPAFLKLAEEFQSQESFLVLGEPVILARLAHKFASGQRVEPQLLRVGGPGVLTPALINPMRRHWPARQIELCTTFAPVKHPVIVELMACMVGSRAANGLPEAWLAEHAAFARPELLRLIAGKHPQSAALQSLAGNAVSKASAKGKASATTKGKTRTTTKGKASATSAPARAKRLLTEKQLDVAVGKVLTTLKSAMKRAKKDQTLEKRAIVTAVHRIIELRADAGHSSPTDSMGHVLGVDGWGDHEPPLQDLGGQKRDVTRWINWAVQASET
jgi:hypothetical protein